MKFKFKPEDFYPKDYPMTGQINPQEAARIANEILDKRMGHFELAFTSEQFVDIEPFIEHAYKPKA